MSVHDKATVNRGTLYVVATPIGNLADISQRAIDVLAQVSRIAAEDTRRSGRLLQYYAITTPMLALHEHNERELAPRLVEQLQQGENLALISDAGTPLISDPGYNLVRLAREADIPVVPVPGASALICALSASGLPTDRFVFEGFLPAKKVSRRTRLEALRQETRTLIFYEASHRLLECLQDMQVIFGVDRYVVLARELTKQFETLHGDTLQQLVRWVQDDPNQQKGEMVLLVQGEAEAEGHEIDARAEQVLLTLLEELPINIAAKLAAKITGLNKRALYERGLQLKLAVIE
ncbi:16S rRNA (cytidine(1402)-2'-O)-methyltransferase [hydrothermal vent metagenome]|uniref:16S rRNA (Cytidine(1402)-2'-O)-methyltransferase n=1 Tax=hydrothermal vent metagenome TaxID=652676 RepID=A0A3B0Y802_9ZZZZ